MSPEALKDLGNEQRRAGDLAAAAQSYRRALEAAPGYAPALYNLGVVLRELDRAAEARECFASLVALDPKDTESLLHLGMIDEARGEPAGAARAYRQALEHDPANALAWLSLGRCCAALGQPDEAVRCLREALEREPAMVDALHSLGNVLLELGRADEALHHYREALRLAPGLATTQSNLGCALLALGRVNEAEAALQGAIELDPGYANAHLNLANAFGLQGRHEEALDAARRALELDPQNPGFAAKALEESTQLCDWTQFDELCERVRRNALRPERQPINPFCLLSIASARREQLALARRFAGMHSAAARQVRRRLDLRFDRGPRERLTLGYLSGDFHAHAAAFLAAELFELHDRTRFRVVAYSYGPDDGSEMRKRLTSSFDRFVELGGLSDEEAALAIHADRADILVDLKAYTLQARTGILALRPAPVQVNYLGYPGTMGAEFIDYLIGDRIVTPLEHASDYDERLVLMPASYQVNDRRRSIGETPPRSTLGLPDHGFVFCCFNQAYKIVPEVFSAWMRVLAAVPESVLWLVDWAPRTCENLRAAARARGVDPARLVFAPKIPLDRHLGRLRAADLFLDTLPYNAHTTASDSLWAGVPVITCTGETFAARVARSLLSAVGLPELATSSLEGYEALAIRLARDRTELESVRRKLRQQRAACALFDTPRFARQLESAYLEMWRRSAAGMPPDHIVVAEAAG